MTENEDWRNLNRAMWDAKTPLHLRSPIYDIDGFKAGKLSLQAHEIADLGDVSGKDLVHLQCHIGLDTLSWGRLGARVTGLDFSEPAIRAATELARDTGVEARFVTSDIYDAPTALGHDYDIVYTGVGALCWLPDLDRWARVVQALLRPGGEFYLFEFHPVEWVLEPGPSGLFEFRHDYFTAPDGWRGGGAVVYADESQPAAAAATVQWNHSLGDVVTALVRAGLVIRALREFDRAVIRTWDVLEAKPDGMFGLPPNLPSMPLMYTLRARRP